MPLHLLAPMLQPVSAGVSSSQCPRRRRQTLEGLTKSMPHQHSQKAGTPDNQTQH